MINLIIKDYKMEENFDYKKLESLMSEPENKSCFDCGIYFC